jgi:endonuclease/exonuclease/phosphatase family metal-dependent hydrolase
MRLLLYNICYGLGFGQRRNLLVSGPRHLLGNKRNLASIAQFIKSVEPDIVGLIEVDMGSHRTAQVNQAEFIAELLGHYSTYECKYGKRSINNYLPILRKQGNAFLAADSIHGERFHYFDYGVKRLVIELEMQDYAVFLVHLSLQALHRRLQLNHLQTLIDKTSKPVIVAGDLNTFNGADELKHFLHVTKMQSANIEELNSFPSWNPRRELDFILHQDGIDINDFEIPDVRYSDHLPLICDFSLR